MDLQKAGIWKRMAAWLLDAILLATVAVGVAWVVSLILGYDGYSQEYANLVASYQEKFPVYEEMVEAMNQDERYLYLSNLLANISNIFISSGLLGAVMLLEFIVPMILKNGQTLGKKAFGLGLIRVDGVQVNSLQVFARALLGKYTVDLMIPVFIFLTLYWGGGDILLLALLGILVISQILFPLFTSTNSCIHDLMVGTVVVELASQRVFRDDEERTEYIKRIAAEQAQNRDY